MSSRRSRHKSSRHTRDYSDSDKESSFKERIKSSVRVSKDSDLYEDYSSSKRRKVKSKDEEKGESLKKSKSSEKSRRRQELDAEEETKRRESSRRDSKEKDREKELKGQDRAKSKRDDRGAGDIGKLTGEKCKDKYRDDKEEDMKRKGDKQRDDRSTKEQSRSDDKLLRDESKKKSRFQDNESDSELDGYSDRDYERERDHRDRRVRRDRSKDQDHDRGRTHDREKARSRDYYHDGKRSKSDRERDSDRVMSRLDDQSGRYKERKEGRTSPDYQDYQVTRGTRSSSRVPDGDMIRSERQPSSSVTKASPREMIKESPSSTRLDRRYNNRSGDAIRSPEVEETGHRNNNTREFSAAEGESKSCNSSHRVGSREEENRVNNTGGRYMGRGQGNNTWRGAWPSPHPNVNIPFQHYPPHGGYQTMMPPQYPSPYGMRPSMEMNHPGYPYGFSGQMPSHGWQNMMMDGSGASQMHGYFGDMSHGSFRGGPNMYGGPEWDHYRQMYSQGWETQNREASMEVPSRHVADDKSGGGQTRHSKKVAAVYPVSVTIDNNEQYCRHYLSKLDISKEIAKPELLESISLLLDVKSIKVDDESSPVFVNLRDGGKRVSKGNRISLATRSLFPSPNNSVFQMAMNLYKEQRSETKGPPNIQNPDKSSESLKAVVSDHIEGNEQDAKAHDGGGGVDQTMEIAHEHDCVPKDDGHVTWTIASPAVVSSEVDERSEDQNMEVVKKEEDDGVVVGDVSPMVTKPLVHKSDESVISRIHHSPQSTL